MVDLHITLAWILAEDEVRAPEFRAYGLGQLKLELEHLRASPNAEHLKGYVSSLEDFLNSQQWEHVTEVNVGAWAGRNLRQMADDVGLSELYATEFQRLSGGAHNMWQHLVRYNLVDCENPLHGLHKRPHIPSSGVVDFAFFELALIEADACLALVRETYDVASTALSSPAQILSDLDDLMAD